MINLPAIPDQPLPATQPRIVYAYPVTEPPRASIGDATRRFRRFLDIMERAADELQEAAYEPYPCAVCGTDVGRWLQWQQRRHFMSHPLTQRAGKVGWVRAVMGP